MGFINTVLKGIGKVASGIVNKIKENKDNKIQVAALELVQNNASKAQASLFPASTANQPPPATTAQSLAFTTPGLNNIDYELSNKNPWYKQVPVWGWIVGGVVLVGTILLLLFKKR